MLYEYALDPELLSNWKDFRYFTESFGVPRGRVISRYPKHWKRLVYESLSRCGEIERKRIEERLIDLDDRIVRRPGSSWDPDEDWLRNAEAEHARHSFTAIVAQANPRRRAFVVTGDEIDEMDPRWKVARTMTIRRTASEMANAIAPFLQLARTIVFIDPHFGPEEPRYRRSMQAFLRAVNRPNGVADPRVEIHTSAKAQARFFANECRQQLAGIIPEGLSVRVVRWQERDGGERLHNRYILTDRGGVQFGAGLDERTSAETDEVTLLDTATYQHRWRQHLTAPYAFDLADETSVVGSDRRKVARLEEDSAMLRSGRTARRAF